MPLSPRMPELGAFEVLLAVAHDGSFGAASRTLGLSQQAVSSRIAALERQTGTKLVDRSSRGSRLTPAGVVAAEWADRLLQVAREIDAGLGALREQQRATVRVSASLTVAEHLMPRWLVSLRLDASARGVAAPEVLLTAANSDHVIADVRDGRADVGFVEGPRVPRGLRSRVVASDELVLLVPPEHAWARRSRPLPAAELARTPLVTREAGSGTREVLDGELRRVLGGDVAPARPALALSTSAAIRAAVLAEAGPTVISRLAVADDLAAGRLRVVEVAGLELHRELRAVWTGGRTPPAGGVRDLLTHIAAVRR